MNELTLADFPIVTFDKIRYADTDRQGHVNNATFSTFLETGRVEIFYHNDKPVLSDGLSFVIASLQLNFIKEINWPGKVEIGTGISKIGNSSIQLYQQLFQNEACVAAAETVVVQVNEETGRSAPLSAQAKESLQNWLLE